MNVAIRYLSDKGIESGMKGKQHAGILTRWALECQEEERTAGEMLVGMNELCAGNSSALRQKLEKAGHLVKTNDAEKLEEDYL